MIGKVLFTKKNPKGIYGFIECQDGTTHYFDTSGIVKGNFIKPNSEVEFDVVPSRGGRTQAINVRLVKETIVFPRLENDRIELLLRVLDNAFIGRDFIDCAGLPNLLKRAGIDYKTYAEDLKTFVDKYLSGYITKRKYVFDGKEYPMVLLPDQHDLIEITEEIRSAILAELERMIDENKYFSAGSIPSVLKGVGIGSYRDYSPSIDSFIESFFPGLFVSKHRVTINGKEQPKIYVHLEDADSFKENDSLTGSKSYPSLNPTIIAQIKKRLSQEIDNCGYIPGGRMPLFLRESGVDDYKV